MSSSRSAVFVVAVLVCGCRPQPEPVFYQPPEYSYYRLSGSTRVGGHEVKVDGLTDLPTYTTPDTSRTMGLPLVVTPRDKHLFLRVAGLRAGPLPSKGYGRPFDIGADRTELEPHLMIDAPMDWKGGDLYLSGTIEEVIVARVEVMFSDLTAIKVTPRPTGPPAAAFNYVKLTGPLQSATTTNGVVATFDPTERPGPDNGSRIHLRWDPARLFPGYNREDVVMRSVKSSEGQISQSSSTFGPGKHESEITLQAEDASPARAKLGRLVVTFHRIVKSHPLSLKIKAAQATREEWDATIAKR